MSTAPKKVVGVLEAGAAYLAGKDVDSPRLACEILLSRLFGCKRLELYLQYESTLSEKQLAAMRRGIKRVGDGEPVQYVTGETEFLGSSFKVDQRALIPRPETECLVKEVLENPSLWSEAHPAIADVGTGTGCIVITLALEKPEGRYLALDASEEAISLAKENAARLRVADSVVFAQAKLDDLLEKESLQPEALDAIVANLPYVTTAEYEALPRHIREHEPRQALDGGSDCLAVLSPVIQDASIALKNDGFVFLEIGHEQADPVTALLRESGFDRIEVLPDLAGRDRIVRGQIAGGT